jgi:phosphoglycolate phosphatase-like HAD superfamily hydrolase
MQKAATLTCGISFFLFAVLARASDPLPSWNDTTPKHAIVAFVGKITQQGGAGFVPVEQRIAVFDMDGTLIPEKPVPAAVAPIVGDVKAAVAKDPALGEKPAIAALLKGDLAGVVAAGPAGQAEIIGAAIDGRTVEEVGADFRNAVGTAKDPKWHRTWPELGYQPMKELFAYLRANDFEIWICSGSPVLFTRQFSQSTFGVPPSRVIGSSLDTQLVERDGRTVLVYTNKGHVNDKDGKPPAINLAIGQRPVFVGGNVGGFGDIAMMRWSKDRDGPSFQLLINHDDAAREFAYAEKDGGSLAAAAKYGFTVVNIASDWKTIFPSAAAAP